MKFTTRSTYPLVLACGLAAGIAQAATMQHDHAHDMHGAAPAKAAKTDASIGVPGVAGKVDRTVEVVMNDTMRFAPDNLTVKAGETIRFVVKNTGQIKHEFNIGTPTSLKEHSEVMLKHSDMQHTDPNVASVMPGKTGEVVWKFTQPGTVTFACLQPGHMSAGMKGSIKVNAAK